MAHPPVLKQCRKCGAELSARAMRAHHCGGTRSSAGRPRQVQTCEYCGFEFSWREMQAHRCPRTRGELIAWLEENARPHRLHGEGSVAMSNRYGTWWCFVSLGQRQDGRRRRKKFSGKTRAEAEAKRDRFLAGLGDQAAELDHRDLGNRSLDQLRLMYGRLVMQCSGSDSTQRCVDGTVWPWPKGAVNRVGGLIPPLTKP